MAAWRRTRRGECTMHRPEREREEERRTKRIPHAIICSLSAPPSVLHFDSSLFPRLTLCFINAHAAEKKEAEDATIRPSDFCEMRSRTWTTLTT